MTLCLLEYVAPVGHHHLLRCPVCGAEARSKYADPTKRKQLCGVVRSGRGVGDELFKVLQEIGVQPSGGCDCAKVRRDLNQLGVEGCRARRDKLLARLRANAAKYGLSDWAAAGWSALWQGKPLTLAGLLDLAIERAESQAAPR